ncbi:MAG: hypothetical protein CBC12_12140 [Candidatus Puniceispirillum sp. TMED52]|nr:hypothetical protein [SAR116 cluster bacterium]OUU46165.1 MAG: hypothetical protein CBC12_12140 [Candidatus Puniceispirillum sp. TMED52]HCP18567.1 hypothetical protein [Alphaproteobacteria bacterium]|tara:strand:- start:1158 stop:1355 length:198 start_codon:yes stop_codon:yes gene_type:complete
MNSGHEAMLATLTAYQKTLSNPQMVIKIMPVRKQPKQDSGLDSSSVFCFRLLEGQRRHRFAAVDS